MEDQFNSLVTNLDLQEQDTFSIMHVNIRSINNKFDDFTEYLRSLDHKFSIIGLSETWLNDTTKNC